MLRVYEPIPTDRSELCQPVDSDDFDNYVADPQWSRRRPPRVRLVHEEYDGELFSYSDAPWWISSVLILRSRAAEAMRTMLEHCGTLRPLKNPETELTLFVPDRTVDALSEGDSALVRFSDGDIMAITKYVFRADRLRADVPAFMLPSPRSAFFVLESFVQRWVENRLSGISFELLWEGKDKARA